MKSLPGTARIAALIVTALAAALLLIVTTGGRADAAGPLFRTDGAAGTYTDGDRIGSWQVVWAGYGAVTVTNGPKTFELAPQAVTDPAATSSALVVSNGDAPATATVQASIATTEQLRQNTAPNAWETAWLVFNYTDPEHFYYVALKTNGWELGKRDPAYPGGQRFLATGETHAAQIGTAQDLVVKTNGSTMTVTIDGDQVTSFTDRELPYEGGKVGMYTEDAVVEFSKVTVLDR